MKVDLGVKIKVICPNCLRILDSFVHSRYGDVIEICVKPHSCKREESRIRIEEYITGFGCSNCGAALTEATKYCKNCGCKLDWYELHQRNQRKEKENRKNEIRCLSCGTALTGEETTYCEDCNEHIVKNHRKEKEND